MKGSELLKQLNDLDGDLIDEAERVQKPGKWWMKWALPAAAAVLLLAVGIVSWPLIVPKKTLSGEDGMLSGGYAAEEYVNLKDAIVVTGTESGITPEEAEKFLNERMEAITNELAASGVGSGQAFYIPGGYSHVRTGKDGNTLAVNWRDYLVFQDGSLKSVVTLTKEKDTLSYSLSFGGLWYDDYAAFLKKHEGEELVYLYVGDAEVVLAPDNELYSPAGPAVSRIFEKGKNYYAYFKTPRNTYVP